MDFSDGKEAVYECKACGTRFAKTVPHSQRNDPPLHTKHRFDEGSPFPGSPAGNYWCGLADFVHWARAA